MFIYKSTIFAFLAIITSTQVIAQNDIKKMKLSELTLMPSVFVESNPSATSSDFYALAPNSKILPTNFDGYNTDQFHDNSGGVNTSILLGFKFAKKDGSAYKPNPILRVGLTYTYVQNITSFAYHEDRFAYDTLVSSNTGEKFPVDSVITTGYDLRYYSQQLKLDMSVLFRTNPEKRWVLFAGVGATIGGSINAKTEINKFVDEYISSTNTSEVYYNKIGYSENYESESTINQNNLTYSGYIPLGVDFRISNNNEFWKQLHVFYEMRPSINVTSVPELRTFTNPAMQIGFGAKIQW